MPTSNIAKLNKKSHTISFPSKSCIIRSSDEEFCFKNVEVIWSKI